MEMENIFLYFVNLKTSLTKNTKNPKTSSQNHSVFYCTITFIRSEYGSTIVQHYCWLNLPNYNPWFLKSLIFFLNYNDSISKVEIAQLYSKASGVRCGTAAACLLVCPVQNSTKLFEILSFLDWNLPRLQILSKENGESHNFLTICLIRAHPMSYTTT